MKTKINKHNIKDFIIDYELGKLSEIQIINLFAFLIKTGIVSTLQPNYNKIAKSLIKSNIIDNKGNIKLINHYKN